MVSFVLEVRDYRISSDHKPRLIFSPFRNSHAYCWAAVQQAMMFCTSGA